MLFGLLVKIWTASVFEVNLGMGAVYCDDCEISPFAFGFFGCPHARSVGLLVPQQQLVAVFGTTPWMSRRVQPVLTLRRPHDNVCSLPKWPHEWNCKKVESSESNTSIPSALSKSCKGGQRILSSICMRVGTLKEWALGPVPERCGCVHWLLDYSGLIV